ncbi:DUF2147 domain-containing protein [Rhizobium laguerreae]|uniref:DUF2147 domain-containing protein n=2 Tax=Rhizobium TaxID=379 RepID=UPI001FE2054D|nr:DUF2147 domain-containing protein [Rhizobium laguerreae]
MSRPGVRRARWSSRSQTRTLGELSGSPDFHDLCDAGPFPADFTPIQQHTRSTQFKELTALHILRRSTVFALTVVAALMSSAAWADNSSPVGLWRNVDDVSGKPRALIRITESNGTLQGRIEKVFLAANESPTCAKCEGALKNAPVVGLVILSGLKKDGDEYTGGQILDPDNGKVYSSKISVTNGGKKLNVRGFIGVSLLGRSQVWERQQ